MLKAPRLSDLQSKPETWGDTLVLAGGAIFFLCICAVALVGFHDRDLPIRGNALSVSTTGGDAAFKSVSGRHQNRQDPK